MKKNRSNVNKIIWNTIGTTLNSFSSMIFLLVITRINGIELSGVFSYAFSMCAIFQSIANYGGRNFQVSDYKKVFSDSEYFSSRFTTVIGSVVVVLAYLLLFLNSFDVIYFVLILMLVKFTETFADVYYGIFQKNDRLDYVGKSYTFKNLLGIIIFFLIDILTKNIYYPVLSMLFVNILIFYFYDYLKVSKVSKLRIVSFKKSSAVLKASFGFFIYNFLILVISNIPRMTVYQFLSESELGYYGILVMIPSVMTLLGALIISPVLTDLSMYHNEKRYTDFDSLVRKLVIITLTISILCMIGAYFLGDPVLSLLYGISFDGYSITFLVFIVAGTFNVLTVILSNLLTIYRKTKFQVFLYLSVLIFGITISIIATIHLGMNGAVFSYFMIMFFQYMLFTAYYTYEKREIRRLD